MAHLGGFEPPTHGLEVRCSILLSYRCLYGAGEGNRTLATSLEGWGSTTELHPQANIEITPGTRDGRFEEPHSDPTTASNFDW